MKKIIAVIVVLSFFAGLTSAAEQKATSTGKCASTSALLTLKATTGH